MKIDRNSPYSAQILERVPLTKAGSSKVSYHLTLDIKGSGMDFKVGDSIGIYGQNNPTLVERVLQALQASGEELIRDPKSQALVFLRWFLLCRANISRSTKALLKVIQPESILLQSGQEEALMQFLQQHDPLDLLQLNLAAKIPLQEFCSQLSPLLPRFYSIASSQRHNPDQIDLTVALSSYTHRGETRYGVASYFLCHLAHEQSTSIPIYVQPTPHFTLPPDPNTPIIMIGPGTGVAPFRGFMQERIVTSASGKNWLFFGERNRTTDFFYEDFWLGLHQQGKIHLDLAFSRDQEEKIYVQHRILEKESALWAWLQEGAVIYVCGEAENMARAVEESWTSIFQRQGGMSHEDAKMHMRSLKKEKRYLADVY